MSGPIKANTDLNDFAFPELDHRIDRVVCYSGLVGHRRPTLDGVPLVVARGPGKDPRERVVEIEEGPNLLLQCSNS